MSRTPGAPVDHQFGPLQVDQVFRKHEADTRVIDKQLAERLAPNRIGRGDFMRTCGCSVAARNGTTAL